MKNLHIFSHIFGISMCCILLFSCEREEVTASGPFASFTASVGSGSETKGTPVENLQDFRNRMEIFTIWGFMNGSPIQGEKSNFYNRNVRIFGDRYFPIDAAGEWDQLALPSGLTRQNEMFYGLAIGGLRDKVEVTQATIDRITFNYESHRPVTDSKDVYYLRDAEALGELMAGVLTSGGVNEDGIIPIVFSHPMASVKFRVGDVNKTFTIKDISFQGVLTSGTCSFTRDNENNIVMSWSDVGTSTDYTQIYDYTVFANTPKDSDINDTKLSKSWFFIPQEFPETSTSKIVIRYELFGKDYTSEIPLEGTKYEINKQYCYTLSKNGVVLESSVASWSLGGNVQKQYSEPGIYW